MHFSDVTEVVAISRSHCAESQGEASFRFKAKRHKSREMGIEAIVGLEVDGIAFRGTAGKNRISACEVEDSLATDTGRIRTMNCHRLSQKISEAVRNPGR